MVDKLRAGIPDEHYERLQDLCNVADMECHSELSGWSQESNWEPDFQTDIRTAVLKAYRLGAGTLKRVSVCKNCRLSIKWTEEGGGWWIHTDGPMSARHGCRWGEGAPVATPTNITEI